MELRRLMAGALRRDGHLVLEAADGSALLLDLDVAYLLSEPADVKLASVIITDVRMPGRDGLSILRSMKEHPFCPPVVLITAFGDAEVHEEARRLGAFAVLDKPFDLESLRSTVRQIASARPENGDARPAAQNAL